MPRRPGLPPAQCLSGGAQVAVPLEGLVDFAQERARLERRKEKLQKEASKLEAQLGNADFIERAPAEKVAELRDANRRHYAANVRRWMKCWRRFHERSFHWFRRIKLNWLDEGALYSSIGLFLARGPRSRRHHHSKRSHAQRAREGTFHRG